MTSTRSITRTGYTHRIEPVMPYDQYPQAYEESLVSPFSSHSYFGKGTWARSVRAAAESVREWREQCEAMLEALERFRASSTSPWRERRLAIDGTAIVGSVRREAKLHTYKIRIVSPSRAETLHSYDLAQQGAAIAGAGRHRFSVRVGDRTSELTVRLTALDNNGRMLAKLREAIVQAGLGLRVALLADSDRQLLSLEITGDEPFRLADLEGSLAASIGVARSSTAAEHARVVIDDGPVQESHGNLLLLDRGRLRLRLVEAGGEQATAKRWASGNEQVAAGRGDAVAERTANGQGEMEAERKQAGDAKTQREAERKQAGGDATQREAERKQAGDAATQRETERKQARGAKTQWEAERKQAGGAKTQLEATVRVEADADAIRQSIASLLEGINLLLKPGSETAGVLKPLQNPGGRAAGALNSTQPPDGRATEAINSMHGGSSTEAIKPLPSPSEGTTEALNPLLLQRIRDAMAHPACARLGIVKSKHDIWTLDERRLLPLLSVDPDRAERELAGPSGWAAQLQETLRRLLELPAREMMNPVDHMMHQFTLYEASMQAYWHMPHSGWMINDQA